jgi:hypothetical protein
VGDLSKYGNLFLNLERRLPICSRAILNYVALIAIKASSTTGC